MQAEDAAMEFEHHLVLESGYDNVSIFKPEVFILNNRTKFALRGRERYKKASKWAWQVAARGAIFKLRCVDNQNIIKSFGR